MEDTEVPDHYFTYDGRLASFQLAQSASAKKSTAKSKASKTLAWPHKQIDPTHLARAGFYFDPTPEFPDNAVCFLCQKRVGGWEAGDDPLQEHMRLSPDCGWAIVTAIEIGVGDRSLDDPSHPDMMEARKATFAGRWPHENKRGWKCKVKQMVDAGWKYTPTMESDDMATCTYCQLALDGWEPADKPMNEHYKRSPNCPFFTLIDQYQQGPAKKAARGKSARSSKASRLSTQSIATVTSEAPSIIDQTAEIDDSVMTTASTMTAGGTKKPRAKKATTTRGRKPKNKKEEPVEILQDKDTQQPEQEAEKEEEMPPPPHPKPARGRKRASDAVEDSVLTNAEAPAPKKRATRARGSQASSVANMSVLEPSQHDQEMPDSAPAVPAAKTTRKKGKSAAGRGARKLSTASVASTVSLASAPSELPEDEELDRQLQADLDRPLSDDEMIAQDSDSERKKAPAKGRGRKAAPKKSTPAVEEQPSEDHAMFDPTPVEVTDADVSVELKQLQEQVEAEEQEPLQVPKKGRKPGTRKVSKQTKTKKAVESKAKAEAESEKNLERETEAEADAQLQAQLEAEAEAAPEPVAVVEQVSAPAPEPAPVEPADDQHDLSVASNVTVLKSSTIAAPAPKKRGRPKKNSAQAEARSIQPPVAPPKPTRVEPTRVEFSDPVQESSTPKKPPVVRAKKLSIAPASVPDDDELQGPSTPGYKILSPAPAAKQPVISPSQSPQSSDAENRPPSSRPSTDATSATRLALAPVETTPVRSSPSRRNANVMAGLQSNLPWSPTDIDLVFEQLGKENAPPKLDLYKGTQLTTPERKMTVEEWIYHNAALAEQRLKAECESMVSKFESEGGRAMRVLEELVVDAE
ncbi:hypothetical protein BX600DRAFT_428688 [Xylariales sp. PMI_506]|nr:hypothetical protein BX600DRAFT_428688 [Xylariales sp. PMI_506]